MTDHALPRAVSKRSGWIPYALAAALLVVIAANAALIHFAFSSWTGLVSGHAYDEGLAFNRTLAEAKAEAALGWRLTVRVQPTDDGAELQMLATDRTGRPLTTLEGEAVWTRPLGSERVVESPLSSAGDGRYTAVTTLPQRGQWDVKIALRRGPESHHLIRRVTLP